MGFRFLYIFGEFTGVSSFGNRHTVAPRACCVLEGSERVLDGVAAVWVVLDTAYQTAGRNVFISILIFHFSGPDTLNHVWNEIVVRDCNECEAAYSAAYSEWKWWHALYHCRLKSGIFAMVRLCVQGPCISIWSVKEHEASLLIVSPPSLDHLNIER